MNIKIKHISQQNNVFNHVLIHINRIKIVIN